MHNPELVSARIESLYGSYLATVEQLERNRKLGEGIFGLKGGPADNPCHDRFAEDLRELLCDFAAEAPESAAVRSVLEYIYEAPKRTAVPKSAYWMLIAVQGLTRELIEKLSPSDADALAERFASLYSRHERLPVQIELLNQLRRFDPESPRRFSLFRKH